MGRQAAEVSLLVDSLGLAEDSVAGIGIFGVVTFLFLGFVSRSDIGRGRLQDILMAAAVVVTAVGAVLMMDTDSYLFTLVAGTLFVVGASALAYRANVMTLSGATTGGLLGVVVLAGGGWEWFIALGGFVFLGAVSTAYGREDKRAMDIEDHARGRGFKSVTANGVVAGVCAIGFAVVPSEPAAGIFAVGFVGALATATADTASSEIGCVADEPRLVTTFEKVPPGTDGGVSAVGEAVTVVGAVSLAVLGFVLGVVTPTGAVVSAVGGIFGAHIDSLLGATIEGKYLGNEGVNLSATLTGAVVAGVLFVL